MLVEIHGDNGVGPGQARAQHDAQPDAAAADDDERLADFDFGIIGNDAETGGEGIGQERANFEICSRGDGGEAVFGNDGVVVKSGDPAGAGLFAVPIIDGRAGFDAFARTPMEDDAVAGFDVADFGADLHDDAAALMAEEVGQKTIRAFDAVNFAQLRTTNAADVDLDEDLPVGEGRDLHLIQHEGMFLFNQDGGGSFQKSI